MDYFYTTIENQKRTDGSFGLLYDHFEGEANGLSAEKRAYAKFYTICAAASTAGIYTEAIILRSDGIVLENKVFNGLPEEGATNVE